MSNTTQLWTDRGAALAAEPERQPWDVYPRPRLIRAGWINLNGQWDFCAEDGKGGGEPRYDQRIRVPFPPESALSGVRGFDGRKTPFLHYRRRFSLAELPAGKRLLLHCGGADQEILCVSFNGAAVSPGCCPLLDGPLTVELPAPRPGENTLELALMDLGGTALPWGKQRKKRGGMWYTPVSGIWQTVWLEWVPEGHITEIRCTPDLEQVTVELFRFPGAEDGTDPWETMEASGPGLPVREGCVLFEGRRWPIRDGKVVLKPESPRLWSPEDPHLYRFTVLCGEDRAESYFALRTVGTGLAAGIPRLLLNGKPYFFKGLLDQGYWPDGLWTPADPACFTEDLERVKQLGFNMVRKHIKIEPELFYYECDRLGIAVFQDMVNCGPYSFLRDTALPTLGLKRLPQLFRLRSRSRWARFRLHMEATVRCLYSHPSVVYWTVYNEGWGQQYTTKAYETLKALDPTRVVDTASGWFRVGKSDVDSRHVYFRPFRMPRRRVPYRAGGCAAGTPPHPASGLRGTPDAPFPARGRLCGKPVVLSEFGGYVWKDPAHSFNPDKSYGYKSFADRAAWQAAFEALWREQIEPNEARGLCAAVYTQLSDVEDETNGLLSYDRKRVKVEN